MAKARRIVWAPRAKQDLLDIWNYYARVASAEIAESILRGLARASESIAILLRDGRAMICFQGYARLLFLRIPSSFA